jgi:hypothetical protein
MNTRGLELGESGVKESYDSKYALLLSFRIVSRLVTILATLIRGEHYGGIGYE